MAIKAKNRGKKDKLKSQEKMTKYIDNINMTFLNKRYNVMEHIRNISRNKLKHSCKHN